MSANDRMPSLWSRRSFLVALAAGSVTALSGCRVQLEEGAPRLPLVPTRVPMKDEKTLLAVLENTRSLGLLANAVAAASTSIAGRLSTVHATQAAVITRLLHDGGVPVSLVESSPTASPTPTPSRATPSSAASSPAVSSLAALSAAESGSLKDVSLADVSIDHVALIGSLKAQRAAAATLLSRPVGPVPLSDLLAADAVALLEAVRSAVYGFEIVATHVDSLGHALSTSALTVLRSHASELKTLVGSSGPPPPLGYQLPFPVTDESSSRRLALHLLNALLTRQAAALEGAVGGANALAALVRWLGETETMAARWGAPLTGFPGLANG